MDTTAHAIEDIGPQPQSFDIERATRVNTNYRSVAWSGRYLQVTLMSIPVGGEIGLEAHEVCETNTSVLACPVGGNVSTFNQLQKVWT